MPARKNGVGGGVAATPKNFKQQKSPLLNHPDQEVGTMTIFPRDSSRPTDGRV
jgi:hypothetical protein